MGATFTDDQVRAIAITQRVSASISLILIAFVILTYLFGPSGFGKPINRIIFYATWSNIGTSVASLISEDGWNFGETAALCQFQGFLVQMFFLEDTIWAFCMAINVYLVIFRDWDTRRLRTLDRLYILVCYGIAFVPAFTFLFIQNRDQGRIYGTAGIWCWITLEWGWLRIAALYGVIWVSLLVSLTIYARAAVVVWQRYDQLKGVFKIFDPEPFNVVTEITVTYESAGAGAPGSDALSLHEVHSTSKAGSLTELTPQHYKADVEATRMPTNPFSRQVAEDQVNVDGWLYARIAFLFCIGMIVTWVPASVNRVYTLANPTAVSFPMNLVASLVLSSHGSWNGIVYILASQTACKRLILKMRAPILVLFGARRRPGVLAAASANASANASASQSRRGSGRPALSSSSLHGSGKKGGHVRVTEDEADTPTLTPLPVASLYGGSPRQDYVGTAW